MFHKSYRPTSAHRLQCATLIVLFYVRVVPPEDNNTALIVGVIFGVCGVVLIVVIVVIVLRRKRKFHLISDLIRQEGYVFASVYYFVCLPVSRKYFFKLWMNF